LHLNLLICVAVPIHDADKSGCVLADSALIQRPVRILEIGGLGLAPENKRSLSYRSKEEATSPTIVQQILRAPLCLIWVDETC